MHLMVYAPYGRTGIYMVQDFCRRIGIRPIDEEMRELMAALGALPAEHPLAMLLRERPDFRNAAALADALLHPQDRAYSVPQLFELLRSCGLTFGRWFRQAPYNPRCGVMARLPQSRASGGAAARGAVRRRRAVPRDDASPQPDRPPRRRAAGPRPVSFAGDAWLDHVPSDCPTRSS